MNWSKIYLVVVTVVAVLGLISTSLLVYVFVVGSQALNDEAYCINEVCYDYDVYYFDVNTNYCSCYLDGEIVISKKIGGE